MWGAYCRAKRNHENSTEMGIMMKETTPQIDVVIPVYRPDYSFPDLIKRLMQQTILPHHIYILQTIEKEGDKLIQAEDERVSVHPVLKKDFDHGGTRHYGAVLAAEGVREQDGRQSYLLCMTQDAVPVDRELFAQLLKPFADTNTAVSFARQLAGEDADILEKLTRIHNYPPQDAIKKKDDLDRLGIKTYFCSDVCAMYRQDVYQELGGFVRPTIFNEDMIMASKVIGAGYQVAYCSQAKVIHSHCYTCMQQFHRNFDLGVSQAQYREVFESISSEKEGAGYAKKVLLYLIKRCRFVKAFYFALQCAFKLLGFKMGKNFARLPRRLVLACTTNPDYALFHMIGK